MLALVIQFLKSGILENGSFYESDSGSPQGGVINPLLANIYLHPLDEMMIKRGHRITRYAGDYVICCKSRKGAERVLRTVVKLLEEKLGLKVHPDKTKIVDNFEEPFIFLGYVFSEKRGSIMGTIGFAIIFAPAIAPTLSGFIIEYVSWRWLFIGLTPFVLITIVLASKYLMNVAETTKAKLDFTSVILSTIGFGCFLYGFSSAGSKGWDHPVVLTTIVVGIIVTTLFCLRQLKSKDPLLNLSVFKYKIFTLTSFINVLITMIMYADLILLPIYLQNGRGFTAFETGLLLLPGAVINAFLSPVTGRMYDKYGAKPLFITGLLFIVISMWGVIQLTESTTYMYLMFRTVILRIGLSFITMPLNTAGLNALPRELGSHGSAVNNTIRQLAGAIGTAVVITMYTIQATSHASELSMEDSNITALQLAKLASIFGSSNAYKLMLVLSFVALIFACFMPKKAVIQENAPKNTVMQKSQS